LVFGFHLPFGAIYLAGLSEDDGVTVGLASNAFIRIDHSGTTTLVMPKVEMGQGVYTALAMILAEEFDADFARVQVVHAPPNEKVYTNPALGVQATGNSNSIRAFCKRGPRQQRAKGRRHGREGGQRRLEGGSARRPCRRRRRPRVGRATGPRGTQIDWYDGPNGRVSSAQM